MTAVLRKNVRLLLCSTHSKAGVFVRVVILFPFFAKKLEIFNLGAFQLKLELVRNQGDELRIRRMNSEFVGLP